MKNSLWQSVKTPPATDNKKYLVLIKPWIGNGLLYEIAYYAHDLYKVDKYDFRYRKGEGGWYYYDSEWGYCKLDNVMFWTELPEPPNIESEDVKSNQ